MLQREGEDCLRPFVGLCVAMEATMKVFEAIRILDRKGRFAPKVLDADGVEIRAGDRVWSTQLDEPHEWIVIDPHEDRDDSQTVLVSIGDRTGHARPENLTHQCPVLAADGNPLREGETVFNERGDKFTVSKVDHERGVFSAIAAFDGREGINFSPIYFSHEHIEHKRPEIDSWERIADEIDRLREDAALHLGDYLYDSDGNDSIQFSMACVAKRCRALAERERGE